MEGRWFGPVLMLAIVGFLFGRLYLINPSYDTVFSGRGGDIQTQFVGWRDFGFERLRAGYIPLWNPYTFGGQPFVGNWQSAIFYPPNWLHLILPVGPALSLIGALHIYLAGLMMRLWAKARGATPLAATMAGITYMLSAPILGHAFPGHITWLCVVAWTPLLFRCVDGLLDSGRNVWIVLASSTIGLMILAGYPQPVYISLLATGIYVVLRAWESAYRWRALGGLALSVILGSVVAGAQFGPGLEATLDSARAGGADWAYATSYSLPIKNLLLFLSPLALGGPANSGSATLIYRGDWNLWEVWPYLGCASLAFALTGLALTPSKQRRWGGTLLLLFLILALGANTPAYAFLYRAIPGAASFRVPGRYLLIVALFGSLFVAFGFDQFRSLTSRRHLRMALTVLTGGLALVALAFAFIPLQGVAPGWLVASAVLYVGITLLHQGFGKWKPAAVLLVALPVIELTFFGTHVLRSSSTRLVLPPAWQTSLATLPEGSRLYVTASAFMNLPLWLRLPGIAGYDPFQMKRWVEYMASTQGLDPRLVTEAPEHMRPHPAWRTLRAGLVIAPDGRSAPLPDPLPHALIVNQAEVIPETVTRLSRLMDPSFDFSRKILLESNPVWPKTKLDPATSESDSLSANFDPSIPGTARVLSSSGDRLEIEYTSPRMAYLLVTDTYARGWQAHLQSSGDSLSVMPANHVVRAVPIPPGKDVVVMEYRPTGWLIGRILTPFGLLVLVGWGGLEWMKFLRNRTRST